METCSGPLAGLRSGPLHDTRGMEVRAVFAQCGWMLLEIRTPERLIEFACHRIECVAAQMAPFAIPALDAGSVSVGAKG